MEPEIIHVPELAKLLGRTESSIRSAIQARPDWLPPYFKQGTRVCWRLESVRKFLREYEAGEHKAVKVAGRGANRLEQECERLRAALEKAALAMWNSEANMDNEAAEAEVALAEAALSDKP